jgi:hypothetical protein
MQENLRVPYLVLAQRQLQLPQAKLAIVSLDCFTDNRRNWRLKKE